MNNENTEQRCCNCKYGWIYVEDTGNGESDYWPGCDIHGVVIPPEDDEAFKAWSKNNVCMFFKRGKRE